MIQRAMWYMQKWTPTGDIQGVIEFSTMVTDPQDPQSTPELNMLFTLPYTSMGISGSEPYEVTINHQTIDLIEEIKLGLEARLGQTVTVTVH